MALSASKCNRLTPLPFKGLIVDLNDLVEHDRKFASAHLQQNGVCLCYKDLNNLQRQKTASLLLV